jgi:Ca2+-dependent lipid-binding protein
MMTSNATTGKLRLTIVEAKLKRDTDFFSKMDPFCVITCREVKYKTKVL